MGGGAQGRPIYLPMTDPSNANEIFVPYDRLIEIEVCGRRESVPENNSILRALQFLAMEKISHADLCWNGDCSNCRVTVRKGERSGSTIACRTLVKEGMQIESLADEIDICRD